VRWRYFSSLSPGARSNRELDPRRDPGLVELQRPEHRAVVGDRERRHLVLGRLAEQRLDPGGPIQQGELRMHMEVDEVLHRRTNASSAPPPP
jgi:hypothetical protein